MSMRIVFAVLLLACAAGCNKIPESEAAKKVGNIPKQTIDRAQSNLDSALKQGTERNNEAEKKEEAAK